MLKTRAFSLNFAWIEKYHFIILILKKRSSLCKIEEDYLSMI